MQQNGRRLLTVRRRPSPLGTIRTLVVHLLLAHLCHGQSQLIGVHQPMVASVGDDVVLPCHLKSPMDVSAKTLEWARADLNPRFVFVWRAHQDLENMKNPSFKGRTSLFTDQLKHGNISLKLTKVQISDGGKYRCYVPDLEADSVVELVVASEDVSSPVISLVGIDRNKGGVVLHCKYKGWFPEPEVLWLDGEGNLLPAGPPETLRGPDGLYTVSSRVTVEKHSSSFTCRVQQKDINQTREAHIYVADDFFEVGSSSAVTAGLAAALAVCILLLLSLLVFVWRRRPNILKEKRSCSKGNKSEEDGETTEPLRRDKVFMQVFNKEKQNKHQLQEEQRRREAVDKLKSLKKELEEKVKLKAELQQLHEDMVVLKAQEKEMEDKLQEKLTELKTIQASLDSLSFPSRGKEKKKRKDEVEDEVMKLREELKSKTTRIQELGDKRAEVLKLQQDYQSMMETSLQVLKDLDSDNMEVEPSQAEEDQPSSSAVSLQRNCLDTDNSSEFATGVDPLGRFLCIKNTTQQEQNLQGWTLELQINNMESFRYEFDKPLMIRAGNLVKLWPPGLCCSDKPNDLEWEDLRPLKPGDTVHGIFFKRTIRFTVSIERQ